MLVKKMYWMITTMGWATCPRLKSIQHHQLKSKQIVETSGLVVSQKILWMHNDSGDTARIFSHALRDQSTQYYALKSVRATDWEDIAIDRKKNTLYIADTGDNREERSKTSIVSYNIDTQQSHIIPVSFETGSIDVEAIAWDPIQEELILMSKGRKGTVHTFAVSPEQPSSEPVKSIHQFSISPANGLNPERITAMDISPDGTYIAARNYIELFLWERAPTASIPQTIRTEPCTYTLPPQKQGESLGFDDTSRSIWTVSEGKNQPVIELRLLGE